MSDEIGPPAGNERCNEFIIQVGLPTCVGTEPVLDVGRVVGVLGLRDKGKPPIPFPLKVPEGPSHLFNGELHFLLISFGSCLALRPMDTVEILTICVDSTCLGCLDDRWWYWCGHSGLWVAGRGRCKRERGRVRGNPDPGILRPSFRRLSFVTHRWTQVAVVQWKEIPPPVGSKFLCWIKGEQSLTCTPVSTCQLLNLAAEAIEDTLGAGRCGGRLCVLSILVLCKLEEPYVATKIGEGVIGLGVSEMKLEIRNTQTREAPGRPVFCGELGGDPELEDLRLALEFVVVFTAINGREPRDVHLPAIVVLTNALGKEAPGLCNLENLISSLDFGLLLVPQATPWGCMRIRQI